jgi:ABC-type phosphate transport system substrate-binding protein
MHLLSKIGIAAAATAAAALSITLAVPAGADTAAQSGDAVGVGSDTLQNAADFVFDGAPGVVGGYNVNGNVHRVVNVDATGDANGRATYDGTCGSTVTATGLGSPCSTTAGAPEVLAGSVVLRAGTKPVIRPNGSGGGDTALIADTNGGYQGLPTGSIQFARLSRLPSASEIQSCDQAASTCGALHVYQAATDTLAIAHQASAYNGPSSLSAEELVSIYTCSVTKWNQLPGNSGGSSATIVPLIPQSGSGTRNFFLADLQAANSGTAVNPGLCVGTVQEHDPTGILSASSPADAIEPFSGGKIALLNSGYFQNGATAGKAAYAPGFLATLGTGAAGDGHAGYSSPRGLYFAVPQTRVASTTRFQPGSSLNYTQALFTDTNSAIRSASGRAEIAAAGFTPAYKDCGQDPTSC